MTKDAKPAEKPAPDKTEKRLAALEAHVARLEALMRANGWTVHD